MEITGTPDGAVWWRTYQHLIRYAGAHASVFPIPEERLPAAYIAHLAVSGNHLWVTGPGAGLIRFDGTNEMPQGLDSEDTGPVTVAPDGAVWLAVGTNEIARFRVMNSPPGIPSARRVDARANWR